MSAFPFARSLGPVPAVEPVRNAPANMPGVPAPHVSAGAQEGDGGLRVLLWHWGKVGAGAKFTEALVGELDRVPGISAGLSAARDTDLDALASRMPALPSWRVDTFRGDKRTWSGRLAAARALLSLPLIVRDFGRSLDEHRAQVALCTFQSIWDAATLPVLARRDGRFVMILHDAQLHPGDWYPFRPTVMRKQVEAADGLIVLSDHVGRMARERYGYPADRIWTVPHGAFAFGDAPSAPRRLSGTGPVRLLFLGRIVAYKGLGHLLDAYRLLREAGVDATLDIVGDGDLSRHAAAIAGLPGVSVTNRWVGEDEIGAALDRSDIVVLPYVEASQSGVAAAAMTAGLPIVATPVGGLVEQVEHGKTGLVAGGMEAAHLAEAITRLCADPALYEACSAGAIRKSVDELGWGTIAARVAGILREVAARPRLRTR